MILARLRALLIIAVLWAACWVPAGYALQSVLERLRENAIDHPPFVWTFWAVWGALSGVAFALVLAVVERGRTSSSLSFRRVVSWGAGGSMVIVLIGFLVAVGLPSLSSFWWPILGAYLAASLVFGGICAAATLSLARLGLHK